ncbi:Rieske 2Fe-2S domain-containing protein [Ideonella sp. B7]|uniref:Rieske (2Fe-2S) protein n=1 Tax=Ideonella benzenivorans TaxID=2831643 RepID=UPI001CECE367|nr:Rieske 2Fe-2S domain-containing protein [Ideonella benzenivorans]MCA6216802.1 Rieske 2Fe-2S domain-containing protein [Ideonella benzenivorans]
MTESVASPSRIALCDSAALAERGDAWVFDVLLWGRPARAFALRFDGRVVGYLNRCVHVTAEMDWQPGRFLDTQRRWIICALHGATYEPSDGYCVAGPGRGQRLHALDLIEEAGQVWWQPDRDVQPAEATH